MQYARSHRGKQDHLQLTLERLLESSSISGGLHPGESERRAIALLLVLVSLGAATILTAAYLASRDNSTMIGQNVTAATEARWGAKTGLDTAIAILETQSDWRTLHTNGRVVSGLALGNSTIDVDLVDLETGLAPRPATTNVGILATAVVGNLAQVATATAVLPLEGGLQVNVGLGEFATTVTDTISLSGTATITRWPNAPLAGMGRRIAVATRATGASAVKISELAAAIDTTVYAPPGASSSLVTNVNGPRIHEIDMLDPVPVPNPPALPAPPKDEGAPASTTELAAPIEITFSARSGGVIIQNDVPITLTGTLDIIAEETMHLKSGARISVDGDVTIVVFDDLVMDPGSSIELEAGATLKLFVVDQIQATDAYIGPRRADQGVRDASGELTWSNPATTQIYGATIDTNWTFQNNTVVVGTLYAPAAELRLSGTTALYGNATIRKLSMQDASAIFYDHGLDDNGGFTNPDSAVYQADGRIEAPILGLTSLQAPAMQRVADALGVTVSSTAYRVPPTASIDPDLGSAGEPTPRVVPVMHHAQTTGFDMDNWRKSEAVSSMDIFGTNTDPETLDAAKTAAETTTQLSAPTTITYVDGMDLTGVKLEQIDLSGMSEAEISDLQAKWLAANSLATL